MKIEKLTEDKIRVILNFSDLEKNHIDAKSVFSRTLEYHDFFMNLLEQAKTEVGFSTDGCRILIEALSTSDEYLVFTITKYLEPSSKGALPLKRPCVKRKSLNNSSKKTIYKFDNFDYFCDFCEYLKNNLNMEIDKISKASSLYFYKFFTNSTAFWISLSSGCPFAIPPTSLNGPNVSYPLHPNLPSTLACFLSKICSMDL